MNYSTIKYCDIANGPGVRTSLFVSGCRRHCKNCFNSVAWDFQYGDPFTEKVQEMLIESMRPVYIDGLTVLGGEPFEPENQRGLLPFIRKVRKELPEKNIWMFSGNTLEEIREGSAHCEVTDELLELIDVLVDGPFVQELYDISLQFRGSKNQRLIDMKKTRETGEITWWEPGVFM